MGEVSTTASGRSSHAHGTLPDADAQLLVETAIESGLRWGELAELRVRDLDMATRMLTVSSKVIEVNREFRA
jgi:integrase